ncbi:hypothetical protein GCM10023238_32090 [Streptomyces heliomycini]
MSVGGRTLNRRAYTYRPDGYLSAVDDQWAGKPFLRPGCCRPGRRRPAQNWSERYVYDASGNQVEAIWPVSHPGSEAIGQRAYAGSGDPPAGAVRFEHDVLGRITLRQKRRPSRRPDTWRYTWTQRTASPRSSLRDGTHWRYRYDALGRRMPNSGWPTTSRRWRGDPVLVGRDDALRRGHPSG